MPYSKKGKVIAWWSAGVTSAVATKLALDSYGKENVRIIYFKIDSAHEDNDRFIKECEEWYGQRIEVWRSDKYVDQFDVIEKTKYINGAMGARCTLELKKSVRFRVEREVDYSHQVFGFEYSKREINRAIRFLEQYPDAGGVFPLIEYKMTKPECLHFLERAGIRRPKMYELGFPNNNPCTLDTKVLTDKGVFEIGRLLGQRVRMLNRGGWVDADINHMGVQPTLELSISRKGSGNKKLRFTPDHKWYCVLRGDKEIDGNTQQLSAGDYLPVVRKGSGEVEHAWRIDDIREAGMNEVACATVVEGLPEFCLEDGILTGNCIGCVKGGAGYWNLVRKHFPEQFNKMAELEEKLGNTCLKDKNGRIPLKNLDPNRGHKQKIIMPDCGNFCDLEFTEIEHKELGQVYEHPDEIKKFYREDELNKPINN